jgi:serine/threonine protein phosphatase 1
VNKPSDSTPGREPKEKRADHQPFRTAHAPGNTIIFAVGDIHGRLDLLEGATAELRKTVAAADAAGEKVLAVFLGDYIDRGPAAKGVISHLIAFRDEGVCDTEFLRGNHEQFLLELIDGADDAGVWLDYGGVETLRSYAPERPIPGAMRELTKLRRLVSDILPPAHEQFLRSTKMCVELGDYLFVHAGLRPDRLLSEQSDADLLWFRYYADEQPIHGKTVVHGHTPRSAPVAGRWRLGIDTGAYASGILTALKLQDEQREFLRIELAPSGGPPRVSRWEETERPGDHHARSSGARRWGSRGSAARRGKRRFFILAFIGAVIAGSRLGSAEMRSLDAQVPQLGSALDVSPADDATRST